MNNFLKNNYEIYFDKPKLSKLAEPLEKLAQQIFDQGLLRISTVAEYNFCLFPMQNGDKYLSFSKREVTNKRLLKNTKKIIKNNLLPSEKLESKKNVNFKLQLIQEEIDKYLPISEQHEMAIARIIVQSAEPVIIQNIINENVYFFISFKESISDLLTVKNWESARFSQGLQSNSSQEASIFASCGGNPFFDPEESNNEYDGQRAINRLSVILAQEIGHYADIIKDKYDRNIDRFSCNLSLTEPKIKTENARQQDLQNIKEIQQKFKDCGLEKVFYLEEKLRIQDKFQKKTLSYFWLYLKAINAQANFVSKCTKAGLGFTKFLYKDNKEIAKTIMTLCGDMEFNINPASMAYRNVDKNAELAVYCAEALARIPQQKVKWGEKIIKFFAPKLFKIFYHNVIKEEMLHHKQVTGKKFVLS